MLSRELLEHIRRIEIRTRRRVQTLFAGEYHSAFRGQGMDFAEVREYVPGDEVRAIDWNVSARMGSPFVKVFQEERELNVLLAVDVSASGRFGSGPKSKREWMAELGAVLAFSAMRNRDKAGLILFSDRIERHVPPAKGTRHGLRLIRDLLAHEAAGRGTDIALLLQHIRRTQKKKAIIFLISDFQAPLDARALRSLARRHDLVALWVRDPLEEALPPLGLLRLEDLESGRGRWLDAGDAAVRRHWRERWAERRRALEGALRAAAVDHLALVAGEDPGRPLEQLFLRRSRRT
ncbi:MAG: DUF58 domain-containing protein [bacterium]|jgi:uncharacterized protein (DUF58 family)|nr:DUF58 domain-containing protein [bacterium]